MAMVKGLVWIEILLASKLETSLLTLEILKLVVLSFCHLHLVDLCGLIVQVKFRWTWMSFKRLCKAVLSVAKERVAWYADGHDFYYLKPESGSVHGMNWLI
ncbi:hypothetical protein Dimus_022157 [Dionaea muscipula]